MAEVHRCAHAHCTYFIQHLFNMNHSVPARELAEYGDISPQVFLCVDVPQNGENIYCYYLCHL